MVVAGRNFRRLRLWSNQGDGLDIEWKCIQVEHVGMGENQQDSIGTAENKRYSDRGYGAIILLLFAQGLSDWCRCPFGGSYHFLLAFHLCVVSIKQSLVLVKHVQDTKAAGYTASTTSTSRTTESPCPPSLVSPLDGYQSFCRLGAVRPLGWVTVRDSFQ